MHGGIKMTSNSVGIKPSFHRHARIIKGTQCTVSVQGAIQKLTVEMSDESYRGETMAAAWGMIVHDGRRGANPQ